MDKKRFIQRITEEYTAELKENKLPLDFRAYRHPYDAWEDHEVFDIKEIEHMWDFVKDAEEWYIDIYENWIEDNRAEFVDRCVTSWEKEETKTETDMKNYGGTISSLYKLLAEKAEGVRICDFKNIDKKVDIYEESGSTIFFYFDHLRGVVFDVDTDHPYISKTFYVWNNVYDDWDEVTFGRDIPLKPNEIIVDEPTNPTPFQIVVVDYVAEKVEIINTYENVDSFEMGEYLIEKGYNLDNIYWMCSTDLQLNFKTIKG